MSTVERRDRALSTNEAPLQRLPASRAEPPLRSRPLSDSYAFHGPADRNGCGAQVQPVTGAEGRPNGLNFSSSSSSSPAPAPAWSNPVIGQPEGKPSSSTRIMKLFSNSRKSPFPTASATTESPGGGGGGGAQAWPGLSGLGVVDSFKKLRSSVLQGIQSRAGGSSEGDLCSSAQDETGNRLNFADGYGGSDGNFSDLGSSRCGSDAEDDDLEDETDGGSGEGDGFARNTHFSRSIRRAYGPGRISLLDLENGTAAGLKPKPEPKLISQQGATAGGVEDDGAAHQAPPAATITVLGRLSKSAENLHIFKAPFRRRAPRPSASEDGPSASEDGPAPPPRGRPPAIQRTVSASAVEPPGRRRSPVKARGPVLRLVGSMTDLAVRRRRSPSPSPSASPASPALLSPLSRLHDDYSRRLPCLPGAERQRRPSPVRARALSAGHAPPGHAQWDDGAPQQQQQHRVLISSPAEGPPDAASLPPPDDAALKSDLAADDSATEAAVPLGGCVCPGPDLDPEQEVTSSPQVREETLLLAQDVSPAATSSPPVSPGSPSGSPSPPPLDATPSPPSSADTSAVRPRRRAGRPRPRPISDYGQLLCRKHSIPEEAVQQRAAAAAETAQNGLSPHGCAGEGAERPEDGGPDGDLENRKLRPASVIGGVDLPTSSAEEKDDGLPSPLSRPPIPSHRVPPYRAVSARFRPTTLSQSTPIGLDRVGHRKLHRVLSDGLSECSATLDDSVSEEEEEEDASFDELADGTPYLQPGVELSALNEWIISGHAVYAEALWDHVTMEEEELAFKAGDVIRILDAPHKDWWWGRGAHRAAWFPSTFVRVRVNQEDSSAESVESVADQEEDASSREAHNIKHKEQMRTNVVQEILKTERIYIKHLKDICDGYIRQCLKHPDMFTEPQLQTIFSNIEDIYRFQKQFLRDLEKNYNKEQPHLSEIGSCFLQHGEGFSIYSDYCNTHPAACAELHRLMKMSKYKHFFESCRLLQKMIDISIAGFLLTPVQKICKYPLQLGELLKYTPKDHSDHGGVSDAYEAMRNVASLINERKRRLESIDTIAHWQVAILRWEGSNVLERSSELIHSGELTRVVRQGKIQQRSFFLFDHQLVFCKKDVLRRDLLHYRGRLDMDQTQVVDVADGRDPDLGATLRNALRLRNAFTLEFVCVLCCRKAEDKQRWLEAFAKERKRVKEDQEMGMEISEEQRKRAIVNARRAKQGKSKTVSQHQQSLHPLHQRHVTIPTSVPQQQVFALAEPPKRKPYDLLYTFTRNAFFRK